MEGEPLVEEPVVPSTRFLVAAIAPDRILAELQNLNLSGRQMRLS